MQWDGRRLCKIVAISRDNVRVCICEIQSKSWINSSIVALSGCCTYCAFVTQYFFLFLFLGFCYSTEAQNLASILCSVLCVIVIIIGQAQVADLFQFECCHQALFVFCFSFVCLLLSLLAEKKCFSSLATACRFSGCCVLQECVALVHELNNQTKKKPSLERIDRDHKYGFIGVSSANTTWPDKEYDVNEAHKIAINQRID